MSFLKNIGTLASGIFKKPSSTLNKLVADNGGNIQGAAKAIFEAQSVIKPLVLGVGAGVAGGALAAPLFGAAGKFSLPKLNFPKLPPLLSKVSPNVIKTGSQLITKVFNSPVPPKVNTALTGIQQKVFGAPPSGNSFVQNSNAPSSQATSPWLTDLNASGGGFSIGTGAPKQNPVWAWVAGAFGLLLLLIVSFKRK